MNIDEYLKNLDDRAREQTNELLKVQTRDYLNFVKELITLGNIMSKKFYIVIPFSPSGDKRPGFFQRSISIFTPTSVIRLQEEKFQKYKAQLEKRVDNVMAGLSNINLNAVRLDTQALIELYYQTYNPDVSQNQKLHNLEELQVEQ